MADEAVVAEQPLSRKEAFLQRGADALAEEYGEKEVSANEVSDTSDGIPEESLESEAGVDSELATEESEETEADTEDGTPDEETDEEGGYESRYKELQATYTETTQELASIKSERANEAAEHVQATQGLDDKYAEAEQMAGFYVNLAGQELAHLNQYSPQNMTQEQYAQWQQQMNAAQGRKQQFEQRLGMVKAQADEARGNEQSRAVAVSRARLERSIDNFDEAYPKMGEYAVSRGVSPKVFQDITDPALIELINDAMKLSEAPDTIDVVSKKTKAKKLKANNREVRDEKGRFKKRQQNLANAKTPAERKQAFLALQGSKLEREYSR
jgi:hypothetical protein